MRMEGVGSMESMQIVLKNKRKLLDGRKKRGFFKRELSYAQVRKYYKDLSVPLTDAGNRITSEPQTNSATIIEAKEKKWKHANCTFYDRCNYIEFRNVLCII
jgi:hypothetical protein